DLREWLASLCASLLRAAAAWAAINAIALYGTVLVLWAAPWVKAVLGSGWLLTVALGVLAGGSEATGTGRGVVRDHIARWSLPVFVVGIFVIIAILVHAVIDAPPPLDLGDEAYVPVQTEPMHPSAKILVERTGDKGKVEVY